MSNLVSLYVGSTSEVVEALRNIDFEADDIVKLKDYLKEAEEDFSMMALSDIYDLKQSEISGEPEERLLRMILWTWIDDPDPSDLPQSVKDELFLDIGLSPEGIEDLRTEIESFDPEKLAQKIHNPNDIFESAEQLTKYLSYWSTAFKDALQNKAGLFFKVWV